MYQLIVCISLAMLAAVLSAPPSFPLQTSRISGINSRCLEPMETGLCLAYFPSFFYNASTGRCQDFIYGGCRGNGNRFSTEEDCMRTCKGSPANTVEIGSSLNNLDDSAVQPAAASQTAAAASSQAAAAAAVSQSATAVASQSAAVVASQPAANSQPSASSETNAAAAAASGSVASTSEVATANAEDVCSLPMERGLCYALLPRFYFNGEKCEQFDFGGCFGNKNNFHSEQECTTACPTTVTSNRSEENVA